MPYYSRGRIIGFIPFPRVLVLCEMQSVSSWIWTRVVVSIFYEDNHYTTGTSFMYIYIYIYICLYIKDIYIYIYIYIYKIYSLYIFSCLNFNNGRNSKLSSVKVPEFGKHLKKAGGHIGQNVVEITIKMKAIGRKPLMKKICISLFS